MTTPQIAMTGNATPLPKGESLGVTLRLAEFLGHKPLLFVYNLLALAALCAFMVLYFQGRITFLPESVRGVPLYAIWFGALGGIVVSLKWVYTPDVEGEAVWYYGRPFSGAIVGGMTYILLQALTPSAPPAAPIVQAAAFIVGIQEKRFFDLLFRVADVILAVPAESEEDRAKKKAASDPTEPRPSQASNPQAAVESSRSG